MIMAFFMMVWLAWLPLMIWWVIKPNYFPLCIGQKLSRSKVFWLNLLIFFLLPSLPVLLTMLISVISPSKPTGLMTAVGAISGIGFVIWVIKLSLRTGGLNSVEATEYEVNANIIFREHKPKTRKKQRTTKPNNKPKPALKEDFELGDDDFCVMQYKNSKGEISTRTILIRTLKANKNDDWFVSAVDVEAKRIKSFRIDKIISLSHNNQTWTEYDDILGIVRTFETLMRF